MAYTQDDLVEVYPFTRQQDGDEVIIGRTDTGVFLALPADAIELLDNLARGKRVREVQEEFERVHGITPDLPDLLDFLDMKGLVKRHVEGTLAFSPGQGRTAQPTSNIRYHFAYIPEALARRFFGPTALFLYLVLISGAITILTLHPSLLPGSSSLYFSNHRTVKILILSVLVWVTLFIHEFFHLLAARAEGVNSRIGLSHRLWVLVAETDLTGLWAVPRSKRYLPMLAGPISDCVSSSLLVFLLFAYEREIISVPADLIDITRAMFFVYMMRLLWQCFFFVRTDFYYVFSTFFGCKNLMGDTQTWLRNLTARLFKSAQATDQTHIPLRERRVIQAYSVLWVLGRGLAFSTLFLVTIPVLLRYLNAMAASLYAGYNSNPYKFIDTLIVSLASLVPLVTGLGMWLTGLIRRRIA